jgi:hypothetical protein
MLKNYFDTDWYNHIKSMDNLVMKATVIVTELFKNDLDKGGNSYLLHLLSVLPVLKWVKWQVQSLQEKQVFLVV